MKTSHKLVAGIFALLVCSTGMKAQTAAASGNDGARISLTPWVSPTVESIPAGAKDLLKNKLSQIASQNGMSGGNGSRFIITANVNVLTKDLTPTAPPMTALTLEVTLCIGDGIDGKKYASQAVTIKGVGTNENKAYIEAFKQLKPADPSIQQFVASGKAKIIDYYNKSCDVIIKKAEMAATQNNFEDALFQLTSVPDECKTCWDKAMASAATVYKKYQEKQCKVALNEAKSQWAASQNTDGAAAAAAILATIDPDATCYKDAVAFRNDIAKRIKELDKREWDFQMKVHNDQVATDKALIQAYRDVGVAYGNGQPDTISYNVVGWW